MQEPNWTRYFDGWQAGAIVLLIAGSAILLVTSRVGSARWLPQPLIDAVQLRQVMAVDDRWARDVDQKPLDVDVRHLGRELRAYNRAAAADDETALLEARARVVRAAGRARAYSEEETLRLRAYQMKRFMGELRRWQATGEHSAEFDALGGDFMAVLARNRWCRGKSRDLVVSERVLRALYKKRWNDVSGLSTGGFELSLDEDRARLGFLIQHPFLNRQQAVPGSPALAERRGNQNRLRSIARLVGRDSAYPANFARGMVLYRMGQYSKASAAFRDHLEGRPDGPHTMQARNFLKASLDLARASGF